MYAGSSYPLEPNQPVILGRDPAYAKIVFSQGAQKISRRHCEVMFNSQVQKYRVTDFFQQRHLRKRKPPPCEFSGAADPGNGACIGR